MPRNFVVKSLTAAAMLVAANAAAQIVAGVRNGTPQTLTPHKPTRAAPNSLLAPVTLHPNVRSSGVQAYTGTPIDVAEYHYDHARTGWNPAETDLTPATVASNKFGLLASLPIDGTALAQPLLVSNFTLPDGSLHDVLIVVTGRNSVYAFDAKTFVTLWQVNLGQGQSPSDVGCGDGADKYGISATPVIVRSGTTATVYLVAATEPSPYNFHTTLHSLDLGTGRDTQTPVEIAPSVKLPNKSVVKFDPQNQWVRAGLAYNNGSIYMGVSSHCDNNANAITGWVLRYGTNLALQNAFNTVRVPHGYELASVWMSGFAPAIDPTGNVFVVTGNGDFTKGVNDYGESAIKLDPNLKVTGFFTPSNYTNLNQYDTDFGSGGIMLVPHITGQTQADSAVAIGKNGILYRISQRTLGQIVPGDTQVLDHRSVGGGVWGATAYWNGPAGPTVFEQGDGGVLQTFGIPAKSPKFVPGPTGSSGAGYGGSFPIVSSNGATPGTGVVWVIRRSAPLEIEAYDAQTLGAPIYSANIGSWPNSNYNAFLTAMEANGRVYVGSYQSVKVFGLTQ